MSRSVEVSVEVSESVVFRFNPPLSIISMSVINGSGEYLWLFTAEESQAKSPEVSSGPRKPPLAAVTYGVLPAGYREKHVAVPLQIGGYYVAVSGEQGKGNATFTL